MKKIIMLIISGLVFSGNIPLRDASDHCARIMGKHPTIRCQNAIQGIVLSSQARPEISGLLYNMIAAENHFHYYFGIRPSLYAVIVLDDDEMDNATKNKLKDLLTYRFSENEAHQTIAHINATSQDSKNDDINIHVFGTDKNLSAKSVEISFDKIADRLNSTIPHEMAHGWFRDFWEKNSDVTFENTVFGKRKDGSLTHYSTPGPDWLDEVAALISEHPDQIVWHKKKFYQNHADFEKDSTKAPYFFIEDFVELLHPTENLLRSDRIVNIKDLKNQNINLTNGSYEVVISSPEKQELSVHDGGLIFTDYLMNRSAGKPVLGAIALHYMQGASFVDWLHTEGSQYGLPNTMDALQQDWEAWYTIEKQKYAGKR